LTFLEGRARAVYLRALYSILCPRKGRKMVWKYNRFCTMSRTAVSVGGMLVLERSQILYANVSSTVNSSLTA
jgi:hypothetical protein